MCPKAYVAVRYQSWSVKTVSYNVCFLLPDVEGEEVDEISAQEDFEDKLKDCIDGLTQKRFATPFIFMHCMNHQAEHLMKLKIN